MYRLLIADSNSEIRRKLMEMNWKEYSVSIIGAAENGQEALNLLQKKTPDILLTDIHLTGIDVLELSRQSMTTHPFLKILFLADQEEFYYAQEGVRLGICDYILKPFTSEEIFTCIDRVCQRLEQERRCLERHKALEKELQNYRVITASSQLLDQPDHASRENTPSLMEKILSYLSSHYMEKVTLRSLAEEMHFSTIYLSRVIKQKTGYTFLEILTNIRMYHAARLLRTTDYKVYEICDRVGLSDVHYFTQVFRKVYGMTPNDYKKYSPSSLKDPFPF